MSISPGSGAKGLKRLIWLKYYFVLKRKNKIDKKNFLQKWFYLAKTNFFNSESKSAISCGAFSIIFCFYFLQLLYLV